MVIYATTVYDLWRVSYENTQYLSFDVFSGAMVKLSRRLIDEGRKPYSFDKLCEYSGLPADDADLFVRKLVYRNFFKASFPLYDCTQWPIVEWLAAPPVPLPEPPKPGEGIERFDRAMTAFLETL